MSMCLLETQSLSHGFQLFSSSSPPSRRLFHLTGDLADLLYAEHTIRRQNSVRELPGPPRTRFLSPLHLQRNQLISLRRFRRYSVSFQRMGGLGYQPHNEGDVRFSGLPRLQSSSRRASRGEHVQHQQLQPQQRKTFL